MKLNPRLSQSAVDLVAAFERFEAQAVPRPGGGFTIGYGHTLTAREGASITEADARALLLFDLNRVADAVEEAVLVPTSEAEFDALVAFAFNVGIERFCGSTALALLNAGEPLRAAEAIERWRLVRGEGGDPVEALVRRRAAEKARFLAPADDSARSSTPLQPPRFELEPSPKELPGEREPEPPAAPQAEAPAPPERPQPPAPPAESPLYPPPPADAAAEPAAEVPLPPSPEPQPTVEPAPVAPASPAPPPPAAVAAEPLRPSLDPFSGVPANDAAPAPPARAADEEPPPHPREWAARVKPEAAVAPSPWGLAAAPTGPRLRLVWLRRLAYAVSGFIGLLLFVGAVISIVEGRANLTNLIFGLLGAALTTPAVFGLLGLGSGGAD